ncbi:MAG: efflux RND transporter periplasmic adaptor subunit, partial [Planctomycetes bacterium]|nr:efflux RND transporter periplasmic adaptor subunit [Planctomycetota bacterium]
FPDPVPCPICGMELIPIDPNAAQVGERQVAMSEAARALANIQTSPVERRAVARAVELVGKVSWDETRVSSLTAWTGGRLDKLYVDFIGASVSEGQALADIWSPELFAAQQELLQIHSALQSSNTESALHASHEKLAAASQAKLIALGMSDSQIEDLIDFEEAEERITLHAPAAGIVLAQNATEGSWVKKGAELFLIADASHVWVELEAFETDLAWLKMGQSATFTVDAFPGQSFMGEVVFMNPTVDPKTRTVGVRLEAENPDGRLRPGMFVRARIQAPLDLNGNVSSAANAALDAPLVIPRTAPLLTVERAVVFLRIPSAENVIFESREITLGPRAQDLWVVLEGLNEGDEIVTKGAFKVDSALQILAKPSMMSMAGEKKAIAFDVPNALRVKLGALADSYLAAQVALADDDATKTQLAGQTALDLLGTLSTDGLENAGLEEWRPVFARMQNGAEAMSQTGDIEAQRTGFDRFSKGYIRAIEVFGYERKSGDTLRVFFCPMAFQDTGAEWIQDYDLLSNPYFGASMLRCGEERRAIPPTESTKE